MKRKDLVCSAIVVGFVVVAVLAACGGGGPEPETPVTEKTPTGMVSPAPPAELGGEDLLQARCTRCHTLDRVQAAAKTLDEWEATVERMRGKGAELTDTEAQTLVEFLAETYAP
jgi:cytochrome c5